MTLGSKLVAHHVGNCLLALIHGGFLVIFRLDTFTTPFSVVFRGKLMFAFDQLRSQLTVNSYCHHIQQSCCSNGANVPNALFIPILANKPKFDYHGTLLYFLKKILLFTSIMNSRLPQIRSANLLYLSSYFTWHLSPWMGRPLEALQRP